MKKLKRIGIVIFFSILMLILFTGATKAASDFDLEKMDFKATVDEAGNMQVTETWQVDIDGETNTLFKTFSKYTSITNVTVKETTNGSSNKFTQSSRYQYHVDTDKYYAMKNSSGDFEIAWGVNKSSGRRTYVINYTISDAVKVYNDCAEIYWQCIGKDFSSPIDEVTGTITLPAKVEVIDNLRVWGHGQLNGEVERTSNDTVSFKMAPYITGTYIEIRTLVLEPEMFGKVTKTSNQNKLDSIISEETKWAEEANLQREQIRKNEQIKFWISMILAIIISAILIIQIRKAWKVIKSTPKMKPSMELDYFRDIPNESSTPSEVGYLYYYGKVGMQSIMPKVLSATMLDLSLKKLVEFEMTEVKKPQVIVKLKQADTGMLKPSEEKIYELLKKIAGSDGSFNVKEIEKYASKHNSSFLATLSAIEQAAKTEQIEQENYNQKTKKQHDAWIAKGSAIPIFIMFVGMFLFVTMDIPLLAAGIVAIISIIYAIFCYTAAGRFSGLTQKGLDEQKQWEGLKRYMEDFSMLNEREVPELVLWEKYLVYATLFGNAEKVLKQLKVVYPEFSNDDYMRNTTYFYLMTHTDFNNSFVRAVDSSMQRAYNSSVASSSSSSGGGFGGGFSGGGGGGFGGGRRRRTLNLKKCNFARKKEKYKGNKTIISKIMQINRHNFGYYVYFRNKKFANA